MGNANAAVGLKSLRSACFYGSFIMVLVFSLYLDSTDVSVFDHSLPVSDIALAMEPENAA